MKKLTIAAISFLALNLGSSSCSNKKPKTVKVNPQIERIFNQMDANKDGKISKTEAKGPLLNDFMRIDMNSDGFLSKEEVAEAAPRNRNGNGQGRPQGGQGGPPNRQ